jgi:hypothetical protein
VVVALVFGLAGLWVMVVRVWWAVLWAGWFVVGVLVAALGLESSRAYLDFRLVFSGMCVIVITPLIGL